MVNVLGTHSDFTKPGVDAEAVMDDNHWHALSDLLFDRQYPQDAWLDETANYC